MTTNPATRPFWVVVGSGIDVRGIDVLGQIFDFSGIEKSEKSIKKTWQEFRDALSKGDFSFDDIASAKKNTFLRVYDDLFNKNAGIEYNTVLISEIEKYCVGRGTILGEDENPDFERFIPKTEFIKEDNRFSPSGVEWLYLAIGKEAAIHECAQAECRVKQNDRFGFCHFQFAADSTALKVVDLTIADEMTSGIMAIGWGEIGDLSTFDSKDAMKIKMREVIDESLSYKNAAHATWQFANEMKIGDIVFVKKGMHQIIGRGVVMSDYEYDDTRDDEYKNIRQVDWTHNGEWPHPGQAVMKTLTDITSYTDYVEKLNSLFKDETEEDAEDVEKTYPPYTKEDFLSEVFMPEEEYEKLSGILRIKKNIILQGAPGVGKTFAAKRIAFSMMGVKDVERVMMVQFHQSYSYEDFIMGFRPSTDGFELKRGAFYNFCKKAEIDGDNDYFFIIDEISLQLLYSDEKFSVPKNIYIIGMMNTADRSLAMLDYALRRRFAFFEIKPGFTTDGFREYRMSLENEKFDKLIACVESLNNVISNDESLGDGFCIGHSYFCNLLPDTIDDQVLSGIVEYELIPLLKEYWFDEPTKVKDWSSNLRSAIK